MNKELELLKFIETYLEQNQRVVLMIVAESSGSSPGRQGFKMAVAEDGTLFGSIGGGIMEVNLVEIAKEFIILTDEKALETFRHPFVFMKNQVHRKVEELSSGMICSGNQWVIFFKINPSNLANIQSIKDLLAKHNQSILEVSERGLRLITPEMTDFDSFWALNGQYLFGGVFNDWGYLEKIGFKQNNLFIIGGGHCALALSELMSKMDFHISLFDDRPNLNTLEKNKFAHSKTIIESYKNIGEFIESGENNYVVVMTLGYKFDEIVIRQLFDKTFKYFGVLGSKSKMRTLFRNLESEGFDKDRLAKIHTPIGLPINSHTPEEIAVSIAAEIIAVKNKAFEV